MIRLVGHARGPRLYVAGFRVHHGAAGALGALVAVATGRRRVAAALAAWSLTDWRDFPFRDSDNH